MGNRLTQKQETLCLKSFEPGNATQAAVIAGYSKNSAAITASRLLTNAKISARLGQLNGKTEAKSIMSVVERKEKLTTIARDGDHRNARGGIDLLNKMDHIYEPGGTTNILIPILNVNVVSASARKATEHIVQGERTE